MKNYLFEIKNRSILIFLACAFTALSCYIYKDVLLFLILMPETNFIFTNVTEVFSVYINLVIFVSNQVFLIFLATHFFYFIAPALYKEEYFYAHSFMKLNLVAWFLVVGFLANILVSLTWNFFLSFQNFSLDGLSGLNSLYFEAKLSEYLDFYVYTYYACLFYFLILLVIVLSLINLKPRYFKKFRKLYYYFLILVATLLSPPDIYSQIIISTISIFCYEIILIIFYYTILIRKPIKTNKNTHS
jgi:sec-independent protein translocase protein TatC